MTVSTATNRIQYNTNGTTGPWTVPFYFLEDSHLGVIYTTSAGVETWLVLDTDYSVVGAGDPLGGYVTTGTAYPAGGTITLLRSVPVTQETDYVETDPFPAETHERALDKLTMLIQQGDYALNSVLRVPETGHILPTFPVVANRALKLAAFDSAGDPVVVDATAGSAGELALLLADPAASGNGAGMIGFGAATYYPDDTIGAAVQDMHGTRAFNLYVSVTGDDSNDGLTLGTPFATLQKAFDTLMAIGVVGGTRTIHVAAGTYSTVANRRAVLGPGEESEVDPDLDTYKASGVLAVNHIVIQGPDVGYDPATNPWPTPTAVFDGGSASLTGLKLEGRGVKVLVKDIKFTNYSGGSATGVTCDGGWLRLENCHFSGCTYGAWAQKGAIEVRGGDFYGTAGKEGIGIRSIFKNYHSIGDPSAVGAMRGPRMRFLEIGVQAQEGGTGHVDSVLFEDCVYGLQATVNARINYSYSNFKRNTCAVRCEFNSVVVGANYATFNEGTADANEEIFWLYAGGRSVDRGYLQTSQSSFAFPDHGQMPQTITGTVTSIHILDADLPMGWYAPQTIYTARSPIIFKIHAGGNFAASLGTRQFKVKLGSTLTAGVTVDAAVNGDWVYEGLVTLHDYNQQSASCVFTAHFPGASKQTWVDVDTGAEDTKNTDTTLSFEVQLSNAADSVTVNYCHFEILG